MEMTTGDLESEAVGTIDQVAEEAQGLVETINPDIIPFLKAVVVESIRFRTDEWTGEGFDLTDADSVIGKTRQSLRRLLVDIDRDLIFTLPDGQRAVLLISVLEQMRRVQFTGVFPFCFWSDQAQ